MTPSITQRNHPLTIPATVNRTDDSTTVARDRQHDGTTGDRLTASRTTAEQLMSYEGSTQQALGVQDRSLSVVSTSSIEPGSSRDEVRELQAALNSNGHDAGVVDGLFGPNTASALESFQTEQIDALEESYGNGTGDARTNALLRAPILRLEQERRDGIAGTETLERLNLSQNSAPSAVSQPVIQTVANVDGVNRASSVAEVAELQQALLDAGFDPGPIDGIFGTKTDAALNAFQRSRIDDIEAAIDRISSTDPRFASMLRSQVDRLESEQAADTAGSETLAQLTRARVSSESGETMIESVESVLDSIGSGPTRRDLDSAVASLQNTDQSDDLAAVISLAAHVDQQQLAYILDELNIEDSELTRIALNPSVFATAAEVADPNNDLVDRGIALLQLSQHAGEFSSSDTMKKFLGVSETAEKFLSVIDSFQEDGSVVDQAQAVLGLVGELRKTAQLFKLERFGGSGELSRLISSSLTLFESRNPLELAAALRDIKSGGTELLEESIARIAKSIVPGLEEALRSADQLPFRVISSIDSTTYTSLTDRQISQLVDISSRVGDDAVDDLASLLDSANRQTTARLISQLSSVEDAAGLKRLVNVLDGIRPDALNALTATDLGNLKKIAADIGDDAATELAQVLGDYSSRDIRHFSNVAKSFDGARLDLFVRTINTAGSAAAKPIVDALGLVDPKALQLMDDFLGAALQVLDRLGVSVITDDIASKTLKGLGKAIPVIGAAFAGFDAFRQFQDFRNEDLPPELRHLNLVGAGLNSSDVAYSLLEPVIAPATLGAGVVPDIALAVGTLAIDITLSIETAKAERDGDDYVAPEWVQHVNVIVAMATGPSGVRTFVDLHGSEASAVAIQSTLDAGVDLAADGLAAARDRLGGLLDDGQSFVENFVGDLERRLVPRVSLFG